MAFVILLLLSIYPSGTVSGDGASDWQNYFSSDPFVVVTETAGMSSDQNEGLRIAVWEDGTVLISPNEDRLGMHLLKGKISPEEFQSLRQAFKTSGLFQHHRTEYVVPGSQYTTISVKGMGDRSWHGYLLPGFGGDINEDEEYYDFVKAWKRCAASLELLVPRDLEHLK